MSNEALMPIILPMIITLYKPGTEGAIRYYTIHDRQPLLTARYALTVAWRKGDGREREKIYGFDTAAERDAKLRAIFKRKTKEGYALLYSYLRERVSPIQAMEGLAESLSV